MVLSLTACSVIHTLLTLKLILEFSRFSGLEKPLFPTQTFTFLYTVPGAGSLTIEDVPFNISTIAVVFPKLFLGSNSTVTISFVPFLNVKHV